MHSDGREVADGSVVEADLCIVGAGPAGITLAREFIGGPVRVVVVEGGSLAFTKSLRALPTLLSWHLRGEQALARGSNKGEPYYPLRFTRFRAFGGSSRAWHDHGLQARPLDAVDLRQRDGLPYSGWPLDRAELEPYYQRAQVVCGLGPYLYEPDAWEARGLGRRLPVPAGVESPVFQFGPNGVFAGYADEFARAGNIELMLRANVTRVAADDRGVRQLECASLRGNRFAVQATTYVLAAGTMENARLLLASDVGNRHDLVGRFFMEHPDVSVGFFLPGPRFEADLLRLYQHQAVGGMAVRAMLRLSDEVLTREGLLNAVLRFTPTYDTGTQSAVRSARILRRSLHRGVLSRETATHMARTAGGARGLLRHQARKLKPGAPQVFALDVMAEQGPDPRSRVKLGRRRDRLGVPTTILDWRLREADWHSIRRTVDLLGDELRKADLGEIVSTLDDPGVPPAVFGNWHQMGTTRMHRDRRRGVVDPDCRVHDTANLYVTGGSVFPTGGYANPTLTVVALALRLADHLKMQLRES